MTPATPTPDPARAISVPGYVVLGALTMITPLATNIYVPALPTVAAAFGTSAASVQLSVSATLIGIAVGQLVIGSVSDHLGRRLPALVGTAAFVVVSILCALAPTLPVLIGLRFLQGFAGASGVVLARASIRDRTEGRYAAQALSRLLIVAAMAPVVAPFVGALALQVVDWRGVFLVLATMGAIAFVMSLRWFPETLRRHADRAGSREQARVARRRLLRDARFWAYVLIAGLLGLVSFSWLSTGPFLLATQYGVDATGYSLVVGLTSLAFLVGAWANSRAVMTIGARRALLRGLVVVAAGSALLLGATLAHAPLAWVVAGAVLAIGAFGGMVANGQALGMMPHPDAAGTASALLGSSQFLLGSFVPPLVTHAFGATWSMSASMLTAAVLAFVLTLAAGGRRAPERSGA